MTATSNRFIEQSLKWLTEDVFPIWSSKGIDPSNGGFIESLSFSGEPQLIPRRTMVQARQIYSFLTGSRLKCLPVEFARATVERGTYYMMEHFSLPSDAFIHSINSDGSPKITNPDLYTQAFALFGLAQAYSISKKREFKERAKNLLRYLKNERQIKGGGFTELDEQGNISFKSNPHMHMFESAIAWMKIDEDQDWKNLGHELATLALTKFIDPQTQVLGEYFDSDWNHLRENGSFIYEPGHQFEWSWLLALYEELTGINTYEVRHKLFLLADEHGTSPTRKVVFDEMWSNHIPKAQTSRFWPQCERIKAAVRLGIDAPIKDQPLYARAADDGMSTLFQFFATPLKGLWFDQLSVEDTFSGNSSKASSLYHIVNAIEEYVSFRRKLAE